MRAAKMSVRLLWLRAKAPRSIAPRKRLRWHVALVVLALTLVGIPLFAVAKDLVCREAGIAGMSDRISAVKAWLGGETTKLSELKLFISRDEDALYIQSNFKSEDPDTPGVFSEHPTKLRIESEIDLETAVQNIIYWGRLPTDASEVARGVLQSAEVYIDRNALGADGRPPVDLSGARNLRIATDAQSISTGRLQTLNLNKPPPALMEQLAGCCLHGRPAGFGTQIRARLQAHAISTSNSGLLLMAPDSGTRLLIEQSAVLRGMAARGRSEGSWSQRLDQALAANRGGNLMLLTHVENGSVVVREANGGEAFRISLQELQAKAVQQEVNLVLFGCETAAYAHDAGVPMGVIGRYNTADAARRIESALEHSQNAEQFLSSVAGEQLQIVVQPGSWSANGVGAAAYRRPSPLALAQRVFRIWFMGAG